MEFIEQFVIRNLKQVEFENLDYLTQDEVMLSRSLSRIVQRYSVLRIP